MPFPQDLETVPVLKGAGATYRAISEMRREAARVPDQSILIDMLYLQEAQASSEIENIVTTQDELFQIGPETDERLGPDQKEVARYRDALLVGHRKMAQMDGILSTNTLVSMMQTLRQTQDRFRPGPWTVLVNESTGEVVYTPPQSLPEIERLMAELDAFINAPSNHDWDPLVAMAVAHHRFETIHPFGDGNGRVGRMLNALYLVKRGLLDVPILYHSRYISRTKDEYYRTLQSVRADGDWETFILYMIEGMRLTAVETSDLLRQINVLFASTKERLRSEHPRAYSHELLNTLFRHPYTRIEYVITATGSSKPTAIRNLTELAEAGILRRERRGRAVYYINVPLVKIFLDRPRMA